MSLPYPSLDDRNFQDIVDDVKRQIGLRCPDWTDHNVSDPGVTLLELFAYMVETMLYRINQVPEKNHIRFLELLGIELETPEPARADLYFRLSRPIPDTLAGDDLEMLLPARSTVVATTQTESEDAIEFAAERPLRLVRPKLSYMVAVPSEGDLEGFAGARAFPLGTDLKEEEGFGIYSRVPVAGDSVYFGFEGLIPMNLVALEVACLTAAATGLNEQYPSQVWEYWSGLTSQWERLEVEDKTRGFNRSGRVEIAMPESLTDRVLGGRRAFWVRSRYTYDPAELPPRGIDGIRPVQYQRSPELISVNALTIGGVVSAAHCATVASEILGVSDGTPGQVFSLRYSPVLRLRSDEVILVGEPGDDYSDLSGWTPWTWVEDFAESLPTDRHFTLDYLTGQISFGPNIVQPDGSGRMYGAIPEKGLSIAISLYRHGGGTGGNVRENKIRQLKRPIPFVDDVTNPRAATGGRDRETLDRAKLRAREKLQVRDRAVTAEDFEFLAAKASSGVGRARCVQPVTYPASSGTEVRPGVIKVLLVPTMSEELQVPRLADLRVTERVRRDVAEFLDQRRLLTSVIEVEEPDYRFISTDIRLVVDPKADADLVGARVTAALNRYIHPLFGGPQQNGWPFRRSLTLADIYAQVGSVHGVAFLLDAKIYVSEVLSREDGVLGKETLVSNAEGIRLGETQLFATRQHTIRVVPMSMVGADAGVEG
ncbi:MAG: putative baseplate assembly protein [Fimbriimonas sp.]